MEFGSSIHDVQKIISNDLGDPVLTSSAIMKFIFVGFTDISTVIGWIGPLTTPLAPSSG